MNPKSFGQRMGEELQKALGARNGQPSPTRSGIKPRGKAAPADGHDVNLTDLGNARRLVRSFGHSLRYCWQWQKWLIWDGRRWKLDESGEIYRRAKATVKAMYAMALDLPDLQRRALQSHAMATERAGRLKAMEELARSEAGIPVAPSELDAHPWLLNCTNGTLELKTGKLREHRREDLLSKICPVAFDPKATCPSWERFLEAVFPDDEDQPDKEMIVFVQRLLGRCLTGDVSEQMLPIFWGGGANGKSTLVNAVMDVLGADYCMKANAQLLMTTGAERHPTELASLFGMRLVVASETPQGRRLNETLVKDLTGGEPIRARRMREDFWEFKPTHKVLLLTNHKPQVQGTDEGIWRRLRLVPFISTFWDPSDPSKDPSALPSNRRQDKTLGAKLQAERTGILAWLVRGCLDAQRLGLTVPDKVRVATAEYRNAEDIIGQWVTECCQTGDASYRARSGELYSSYHKWCENAGEKPLSQKLFGPHLAGRGFQKKESHGIWYVGIALNTD